MSSINISKIIISRTSYNTITRNIKSIAPLKVLIAHVSSINISMTTICKTINIIAYNIKSIAPLKGLIA
jgi:hypothetical protein